MVVPPQRVVLGSHRGGVLAGDLSVALVPVGVDPLPVVRSDS